MAGTPLPPLLNCWLANLFPGGEGAPQGFGGGAGEGWQLHTSWSSPECLKRPTLNAQHPTPNVLTRPSPRPWWTGLGRRTGARGGEGGPSWRGQSWGSLLGFVGVLPMQGGPQHSTFQLPPDRTNIERPTSNIERRTELARAQGVRRSMFGVLRLGGGLTILR